MGRPTIKQIKDTTKLLCPQPLWKQLVTTENVSHCPCSSPLFPTDWCSCHTRLPCQAGGHSGRLGECLHHQTPCAWLCQLITGMGIVTAVPSAHSRILNPSYDGVFLVPPTGCCGEIRKPLGQSLKLWGVQWYLHRAKASKTFVTSLNLRCHFGDCKCPIETRVRDTPTMLAIVIWVWQPPSWPVPLIPFLGTEIMS